MLELKGTYHSNFGNETQNRATLDGNGMIPGVNTFVFYATKLDGEPWTDRNEMKATYEDRLCFYKKLGDIPEGETCVGILTCFKGMGTEEPIEAMYQVAHEATVLKDNANIGETCVLVSTSRAWVEDEFEKNEIDLNDIQFSGENSFTGLPTGLPKKHMRSANTPGYGYAAYRIINNDSVELVGQWNIEGDYFYNPFISDESQRGKLTIWNQDYGPPDRI